MKGHARMHGITSLGHAAINVKNLDKSLAFYTEGLEFPSEVGFEPAHVLLHDAVQ